MTSVQDNSDIAEVLRKNAGKVRNKWRKVLTGNETKRVRDLLKETEDKPKYVKLYDKLGFTFGVLNILFCEYFLLSLPEYFSIWASIIIPIILISRLYHFYSLGWHYFLIDFCYFVNICSLVNIYFFSKSLLFFKICFFHAVGTLPSAIIIWRNSLVFHDYDKIVSIYIHLLPCMLYYCLRWNDQGIAKLLSSSFEADGSSAAYLSFSDYCMSLLLYIIWQISYIYKTEFLDKEKFKANPQLLTSLRWMSKDTKNPFARTALKLLRKTKLFRKDEDYDSTSLKTKGVFVTAQFFVTMISILPGFFLFNHRFAHLLYIGIVFTISLFNGASFYIDVFSVRYRLQLEKLEKLKDVAREATTVIKQIQELGVETKQTAPADESATERTRDRADSSVSESRNGRPRRKSLEEISADLRETTNQAIKQIIKTGSDMYTGFDNTPNPLLEGLTGEKGLFNEDPSLLEDYLLNIDDDDSLSRSSDFSPQSFDEHESPTNQEKDKKQQ
jgi:hypothetical protein